MKNLKKAIKRTICMLLTVAMLCTDTGVTAYAAEGVEQKALEESVEETSTGNMQAEEVQEDGDVKAEDGQTDESSKENERTEGDLAEEGETGESSPEETPVKGEITDENSGEENAETGVTEENSTAEDGMEDENLDGEDEENTGDVSAEENLDTVTIASRDNIASGEYKENGNDIAWVIDASGKLTVEGTGDFEREFRFAGDDWPVPSWYKYNTEITSAEINVTGMTYAARMFYNCCNMTSVDLSGFDTSNVYDMNSMFSGCSSLRSIDVSGFDTSSVEDMGGMFSGCSSLRSIDVSGFDTSNVFDMVGMFSGCSSLESIDVSGFDTSNVFDMGGMFSGCSSLESIDVSGFDTSNVYDMNSMFSGCSSLRSIDVSGFDTSSVEDMGGMFSGCSSLRSIDVSRFDTSNVSGSYINSYGMRGMFSGCSSLKSIDVSGFDTSHVFDMADMFSGCSSLGNIDVSGFNTEYVTDMSSMFKDCSSLESIDVSRFFCENVEDMSHMFSGCSSLKSIYVNGCYTCCKNMAKMFYGCNSLISLDMRNSDTSNVTDMSDMFFNCNNLQTINTPYNLKLSVELPGEPTDIWYRADGSQITELPQNLDHSILIKKNEIPIISAIKATKTKTNYICDDTINVDDLTVTYYDADSIERKLEESEYTTNADEIDMSTAGKKTLIITYDDGGNVITDEIELTVTEKKSENVIASGEYKENGNDITWVIDANGKLTVMGTGDFASYFDMYSAPWYSHRDSILSAEIDVTEMTNTSYMFYGCRNLTSVNIKNFNTQKVTNMKGMFYGCSKLVSVDASSFDTSRVTNMEYMFSGCSSLTSVDVSGFNTKNVTNMNAMFQSCHSLTSVDVSGFDTRNVTDMGFMFNGCDNLTSVDVSSFDTRNVTDMDAMFGSCKSLTSVDVSGFDTRNVTDMGDMFGGCESLTSVDVSSFDTSNVTDMDGMFRYCYSLTSVDVSSFDTKKVTDMTEMFRRCGSLTDIDVSSFDTSNVTDMWFMFCGCSSLTSVDMSNFDVGKVTKIDYLFAEDCSGLTTIYTPYNLSQSVSLPTGGTWYRLDGTAITELPQGLSYSIMISKNNIPAISAPYITVKKTKTVYECGDVLNIDDLIVKFYDTDGTVKVITDYRTNIDEINMSELGNKTLKVIYSDMEAIVDIVVNEKRAIASGEYKEDGNDITWVIDNNGKLTVTGTGDYADNPAYLANPGARSPWYKHRDEIKSAEIHVSGMTNASYMFNDCSELTSVDVSNFDTSQVTSMYQMFDGCSSLTSVDVSSFNTGNVTNMDCMFCGCSNLTSIDLGNFNTSQVTDMRLMFSGCKNLTDLDLSGFDTSQVTDMYAMFWGCSNLTDLDMSDFDTGKVTDMYGMFLGCSNLIDLDVSNFDTSQVTNMHYMFYDCDKLASLDVSSFNTSQVTNMSRMFSGCNKLTSLNLNSFNTSQVTDMSYMFNGCQNLTSLDLSGFNTSQVTTMESMFGTTSSLISLDLSNFNTGNVTNMGVMFTNCWALTSLDVSNFDTSNVTDMSLMFSNCSSLTSIDLGSFDTKNVTDMLSMLGLDDKLTTIRTPYNLKLSVQLPTGSWYQADGTTLTELPQNLDHSIVIKKNEVPLISALKIGKIKTNYVCGETINLDDLTVTYYDADGMSHKLEENEYTTNADEIVMSTAGKKTLIITYDDDGKTIIDEIELTVTKPENIIASGEYKENGNNITWVIDADGKLTVEGTGDFSDSKYSSRAPWYDQRTSIKLAKIDVTDMTNASYMFYGCSNLTELDLSNFNTSRVTNMGGMFWNCSLTSLVLSNFDTSNVTDMGNMFYGCSDLTDLDLSNFDTSQVTKMNWMFYDCGSLISLDLSNFDVSKVTNAYNMLPEPEWRDDGELKTIRTPYNLTVSVDLPEGDWYQTDGTQITKLPRNLDHSILINKDGLPIFSELKATKTKKLYACGDAVNIDDLTILYYDADGMPHKLEENDYTTNADEIDTSKAGKKTLIITYHDDENVFNDEIELIVIGENIIASGEYNNIIWFIDADGKLTVEGTGNFTDHKCEWGWYGHYHHSIAPWYSYRNDIISAEVNVTDMTNASHMFYGCRSLTSLDVSGFDTSKVKDMHDMFSWCSSLTSLDVSGFDTSEVRDMNGMFYNCERLTSLNVGGFDTSNVTDIGYMFSGCSSLTSLDLSGMDASKIDTYTYTEPDSVFDGCKNLTTINTPLNLRRSITLPRESTDIWYQIDGTKIAELPQNLNYSIVIRKNEIPVITSAITVTKTKTNYACGDIVNTDDLVVTHYDADGVGTKVTEGYSTNVGEIDTSTPGIKILKITYNGLTATVRLNVKRPVGGTFGDITWIIDADGKLTVEGTGDFSNDKYGERAPWFDYRYDIISAEINVTDMTNASYMFSDCDYITSINLAGFDTGKVTDMRGMFSSCESLTSLDVSGFDTSKVTGMRWMFSGCENLTSLNMSGFDTSEVTDMEYMFYGCKNLTSLDMSGFDTSKVTDMYYMFSGCGNLTSLDMSSFDTSNVKDMGGIFKGCTSLTTIHTPYNYLLPKYPVKLPKSESTDIWTDESGNEYEELPQNINYSILLTKKKVSVTEEILLSAENVTITLPLPDTYNYVYNGQPKTPEVTVTYTVSGNTVSGNSVSGNTVSGNSANKNSITLNKETDYTITYGNNINAFENVTDTDTSDASNAAPKVIITGQNKYSGTVSQAFSIQKADAPEAEEQIIYIKDYTIAHEGCTLDLSGCFAGYNDKTGYTAGNPIEDDTISGSVLSAEVSLNDKGILTYSTNAGESGDFVVIPIIVSFSNHNDALINVKIVLKDNGNVQIEKVSIPTASPESGRQLTTGSEVTLACETEGAEIYYTISGNRKELIDPTENSAKYTAPIIINSEVYIRAVAIKGSNRSKFINLHYTVADIEDKVLKPYAAPRQGAVEKGTKVELKCDTPDAVIYYAMGGNADIIGAVPIDDDHKYTEPIEITKDLAIKAIAKKDGMKDSDFSTFVYRINVTLDAPAAEPASGTVDQGSYISLKADSDVNIYYTMDHTDPVTSGSAKLYESRIRVEGNAGSVIVIKAAAEKKGIYSKPVTFTYMISESTVKGLQVMLAGSEEFIYTGSAITPAVIVTNNGEELIEGEDYTVRYSNNVKAADKSAGKAPKITVSGKGNLTKSTSVTFTIKPKDIGDEEEVVGGSIAVMSGKSAAPVLFYDGVKLTAKDFDNPNAKKKYTEDETITITGKGNFEGERDIDVRVVSKDDMKKFTVAIDNKALKREPLIYDGEEKTLDGYFEVYDAADKSSPLEEYSDYAVIYPKNNINAGKVKFTVVGLGEYYGTVTKAYTINPRVIKTGEDGAIDVSVNNGDEYPFRSGGVTIPDLTVTCDGDVLTLGRDYKVTYSNNKKICTNNKAKCTISFTGNYKGSKAIVRKFNITATMMDDVDKINESVSVAVADMVYTGKPGAYKSIPYVTVNGVLLKSSDYNVSYYKDVDRSQVIDGKTPSTSLDLTDSDKQTVYMKIEGKGNYNGTLTAEYNVYKLNEGAIDLSKAKVIIVGGNKVEYTGEGVGPDIEIKYKSGSEWKTVDADDIGTYVTVTYINNVNKGKATVMINGNGDRYVGSKTAVFSIVPKSMK